MAGAVGELNVFLLHLVSFALLLLLPFLLGLLLLLQLPVDVLLALQAHQRPPALHPLGAEDGEARPGAVPGHLGRALIRGLGRPHHVVETQLYRA